MSYYSPSIEKLIESFEKLPSIGSKTAARLAFYILLKAYKMQKPT